MAIEASPAGPEAPALLSLLRTLQPNVAEAVCVTLEARKILGIPSDPDKDRATEELTGAYSQLLTLGYDGRLYVEPPASVSFKRIVDAAEGKRPADVAPVYRYPNLWVPGTEKRGIATKLLNRAPAVEAARLAIFNADTTTGVDPLLHFLGMPYDNVHRDGASQTQLEALEAVKEEFGRRHPKAFLQALGHRAAAMLVFMDRIRGVEKVDPKSDKFVLNTGYMRLPDLGRRAVGGHSVVGNVDSRRGRLWFDGGDGRAPSDDGFGLSAGLEELEPQAS